MPEDTGNLLQVVLVRETELSRFLGTEPRTVLATGAPGMPRFSGLAWHFGSQLCPVPGHSARVGRCLLGDLPGVDAGPRAWDREATDFQAFLSRAEPSRRKVTAITKP